MVERKHKFGFFSIILENGSIGGLLFKKIKKSSSKTKLIAVVTLLVFVGWAFGWANAAIQVHTAPYAANSVPFFIVYNLFLVFSLNYNRKGI